MKKRKTGKDGPVSGEEDGSCMGLDSAYLEEIRGLCDNLTSGDRVAQLDATQKVRTLLSIEQGPFIQAVICVGIVPRFVQFLEEGGQPDLQFEAACVLTSITSGSAKQLSILVEQGVVPIFVKLLWSPSHALQAQAVLAVGSIANHSHLRDLVLQSGGLDPIMQVMKESKKLSTMRSAARALSNFCSLYPSPPSWLAVAPALTPLMNLISASDEEVLAGTCSALSQLLLLNEADVVDAINQAGACSRLIDLLRNPSPLVQAPVLQILVQLTAGDHAQVQVLLQAGLLPIMLQLLLQSTSRKVHAEACWIISNIAAGHEDQIQAVIDMGLIPPIMNLLKTADFSVKKEALWVLSNSVADGTPAQIAFLIEIGCIALIVDIIPSIHHPPTLSLALRSLENMLKLGKLKQRELRLDENLVAHLIEEANGLAVLEALQEDNNMEVYTKAMSILETYFPLESPVDGEDGDEDDDGAAPGNKARNIVVTINLSVDGLELVATALSGKSLSIDIKSEVLTFAHLRQRVAKFMGLDIFAASLLRFATECGQLVSPSSLNDEVVAVMRPSLADNVSTHAVVR